MLEMIAVPGSAGVPPANEGAGQPEFSRTPRFTDCEAAAMFTRSVAGGPHAFDGWGAVEIRCEADYKREVARIAERDSDENRVTGETLRWELWKELKSSRRAFEAELLREPDSAPRPPFTDAWAALRMYKNEWLEAMKAEFGLGVEEC